MPTATAAAAPPAAPCPTSSIPAREDLTFSQACSRYQWLLSKLIGEGISVDQVGWVMVGSMDHLRLLQDIGTQPGPPPFYKQLHFGTYTIIVVSAPKTDDPPWRPGTQFHDDRLEVNIINFAATRS